MVLGWLARHTRNCEIASLLDRSERTIENHVIAIFRKLGVAKRGEAAALHREWSALGLPLPPRPKQGQCKA